MGKKESRAPGRRVEKIEGLVRGKKDEKAKKEMQLG